MKSVFVMTYVISISVILLINMIFTDHRGIKMKSSG